MIAIDLEAQHSGVGGPDSSTPRRLWLLVQLVTTGSAEVSLYPFRQQLSVDFDGMIGLDHPCTRFFVLMTLMTSLDC